MINSTILSAKAAAAFLGISNSTLSKWRLSGGGPIYIKAGRRVVYRQSDLEKWLEARAKRSTSEYEVRRDA